SKRLNIRARIGLRIRRSYTPREINPRRPRPRCTQRRSLTARSEGLPPASFGKRWKRNPTESTRNTLRRPAAFKEKSWLGRTEPKKQLNTRRTVVFKERQS